MAYKYNKKTIAYNNQYNTEKYDRVAVMLPQGEKDEVKSHAAARGESVNGFIKRAISETIVRDKENPGD